MRPTYASKFCSFLIFALAYTGHASAAPNPTAEAKAFYEGLWAAPGSSQRMQSGILLQNWLDRAYLKTDTTKHQRESQLTKSIIQLTADYLKAKHTCAQTEKVRLFRGINEHGMYERDDRKLNLWSRWPYLATTEMKEIPMNRQEINRPDPFADLNFKMVENKDINEQILNFNWSRITSNHSSEDGTAASTVLISTSLEWTAAKAFAGKYMLVLDVCLERAVALNNQKNGTSLFFPEAEVYLPLFVLPEEIVQVIEMPSDPQLFDLPGEAKAKRGSLSSYLRRNFFNTDLPFDISYVRTISMDANLFFQGLAALEEYKKNYDPERLQKGILTYENTQNIVSWRQHMIDLIRKTGFNKAACRYAVEKFHISEVFERVSQFQKEKPEYFFSDKLKLQPAQFDFSEYTAVKEAKQASDGNPKDVYFDYFEAYDKHRMFMEEKGYLERCEKRAEHPERDEDEPSKN